MTTTHYFNPAFRHAAVCSPLPSGRRPLRARCFQGHRAAFTLIELLVVIVIIAVLAGLFLPVLARAQSKVRAIGCMNQMRQIALAVRFYADDNGDEFPRSQHSAFAYSQLTWGRALAPWLGPQGSTWTNLLLSFYHCPGDKRPAAWSYGQNVYFELGDDDDYFGKPKTWRLLTRISKPCATILFAENATGADHIMAHFWTTPTDAADVDAARHCGRANYIFVDGHAQCSDLRDTFDPARSRDAWNPQTAQ